MEEDGRGVVLIPSQNSSSPPHDDDHPDFSPVGSPECHFIDDLSQPSDQLHAQVTDTDDLRNKIIKQVEYYFSDENLPTDKFLLKYVTRDKEGFVPVKVIASFRKVKNLMKETSIIAAALRESSLLVVSPDGRKVKRLHPLPLSEIKDPKVCTVLVENLPEDHSVDNLRRIFGQAGNVKHITIRDPHTERDPRKCTTAEKLLSGKLHALVEYNTVEAAEKAVAILNDEQDWRFGLRVKLLLKKTVICFVSLSSFPYILNNSFVTSLAKVRKAGEIQILIGITISKHLIWQLMGKTIQLSIVLIHKMKRRVTIYQRRPLGGSMHKRRKVGPGCQPEIEAVEGETSVAQMDMAMELLPPLMWLNRRNPLLVQECLMEPEDLLWDEVDLFLHLQANDVLSNMSYCKYILCFWIELLCIQCEKCLDDEFLWLVLRICKCSTVGQRYNVVFALCTIIYVIKRLPLYQFCCRSSVMFADVQDENPPPKITLF